MKYPFLRSIRTQLLILVLLSVLPALGIVIYSGFDRQYRDIENAKGNALRVLQSFASDHERTVESTRQLLITLAQLPDVQNLNAPACNRLFVLLLKENPVFANISATTAEGEVFADALPFTPHSVKERKYFQDILRTKDFSVGEYVIEATLKKPVLHLAYPIIDARGKFKGAVAVAFGVDRYGQMFTRTELPEDSVLGIYDHKHIRLLRSHESEKYVGKIDGSEMVKYMSAPPEEGSFTAIGNDGVKRFMAYRRFYLKGSKTPYLSMRVGIAETQALARARHTLFNSIVLLCATLVIIMALAWFLGNIIIARRLKKLVDVTQRLGHGDLTARTELDHREDELGQLTKSFDEMAVALERNASDRILAEKAMQESEKRLHSIIQGSPISIFVINNDHRIVYWNKALEELTGIKAKEVIGTRRHWGAFYSKERPCLADLLVDQIPDVIPLWYEGKCLRSKLIDEAYELTDFSPLLGDNGKWIRFTAAIIRNPEGGLVGAIETIEDITERKLAQMAIQESENKYRTLVENLNMGIYRSTGDAQGRFLQANPAIAKMFGYNSVEDFMNVSFSDLYQNPEDRKLFGEELARSGSVTSKELRLRKIDGQLIWASVTARAHLDETDHIGWIDGVIEDITDKKIIEQELIHKEKLSSLGMLVSGISHEINNPNNFIVFNIPILRDYFKELIPIIDEYAAMHPNYNLFGMTYGEFREDIFKLMDNIEHGAERINTTVSNLQEFSRKKVKGSRKQIRVQDILDKAVAICRSQINKSVKSFEICAEEGLSEVVTDPEALEQVLINLLINATQAMHKKDSFIKIQLLRGGAQSGDIVIEVMDNGIGFDEQTKARLFEPFFTTKPAGMGTGIGLYIVKKIMDKTSGGASR